MRGGYGARGGLQFAQCLGDRAASGGAVSSYGQELQQLVLPAFLAMRQAPHRQEPYDVAEGQDREGGPPKCHHRNPPRCGCRIAGRTVVQVRQLAAATMSFAIWTPQPMPPNVTQNGSIGLSDRSSGEATVEETSGRQEHPVAFVTKLVGLGKVSPRNASIWLRTAGMAPAPVTRKGLANNWDLTVRQVHNVHRAVTLQLPASSPAAAAHAGTAPSGAMLEAALAAVHAQLDVGDHDVRQDASRALRTLAAQARGVAVPRNRAHPQGSPARSRGYRLRAHLKERIERLPPDPPSRYPAPFLAVGQPLPAPLARLVPGTVRSRSGPPDTDCLAGLLADLRDAHTRKDGRAAALTEVCLWALAQYPTSPDPALESEMLRICAIELRQQSARMAAVWAARRIRQLQGPYAPATLYAVHDEAIALRGNGYHLRALHVLRQALENTKRAECAEAERHLITCVLMSQLVHVALDLRHQTTLLDARPLSRSYFDFNQRTGVHFYLPAAARSQFETEFVLATDRARRDRERFWIPASVRRMYDTTDKIIRASGSEIWTAQWAILTMQLGIGHRDSDAVIAAAAEFASFVSTVPWIRRDHPSELVHYNLVRDRAVKASPALDADLPPL